MGALEIGNKFPGQFLCKMASFQFSKNGLILI